MVTLVYDNRGYGEIRAAMDGAGVHHLGTDASTHDLLQIAAGFGVRAVRSGSLAELEHQLSDALTADGPTVVAYVETEP